MHSYILACCTLFVLFVNACLLFSTLVMTTWNYEVVLPSKVILPLGFTPVLCFNNYYGYFWIVLFVLSFTNMLYLISLFWDFVNCLVHTKSAINCQLFVHNFHWSCLCAWFGYRDSVDLHALLNHAYHAKNAEHRADHLGFHKALCVLMGWNYSVSPVFKTAYQALSTAAAEANQGDLILWPPTVIIENTYKSKNDGQKDVMSNKELESKLRGIPSMLALSLCSW